MMSRYSKQAFKIGKNELSEMGEALESFISVVDWSGNGGRDILYNANPRFFGGGTYLYREDKTVNSAIPVYHAAEYLEGLKGRYCIPFVFKDNMGFNILTLEEGHLVLYKNTGTRKNPWFGESKEDLLHVESFIYTFTGKRTSPNSIHSFNMPGQDVTHIVMVCSAEGRRSYWPGGKSLWRDNEHPIGGFGRGYDEKGKWRGDEYKNSAVYVLRNSGTNENPIFKSCEEIYRFTSMDHNANAAIVDIDGDGKPELLLRINIDRLYMLKLNDDLKPAGELEEMKCSPLKRSHYETSFFPCDINNDGKIDIVISGNPGVVFWLENTEEGLVERPPLLKRGGDVKVETLSVPCLADIDNDGYMELIAGDSSGFLWYFDNLNDETNKYIFKAGKQMKADGKEIHHQAGYSGSIQGPAEKRWGYLNPLLVDWDGDGLIDIITNDITGRIKWYRNIGTKDNPVLAEAKALMCDDKEFVAAWRSRPAMWDDNTIIAINVDGFAQFFKKDRNDLLIVHEGKLLRYLDGGAVKCCGPGGHLGRTVLFACDWDGDGVLDIVGGTHRDLTRHVNAFFPRKATVFWLKNVGTNSEPMFERPRLITLKDGSPIDFVCHKCAPWCIDMDGDGKPDLVLGAEDGKVYAWLRNELKWDWEAHKDFNNDDD